MINLFFQRWIRISILVPIVNQRNPCPLNKFLFESTFWFKVTILRIGFLLQGTWDISPVLQFFIIWFTCIKWCQSISHFGTNLLSRSFLRFVVNLFNKFRRMLNVDFALLFYFSNINILLGKSHRILLFQFSLSLN